MQLFQLPLDITTIASRVDRSVKLTAETTQELSDESAAVLFSLRGRTVWAAFLDAEIKAEDLKVPDVLPRKSGEKTRSQKLRAVIYRMWESRGGEGEFEAFYEKFMDDIISFYKAKLDDTEAN